MKKAWFIALLGWCWMFQAMYGQATEPLPRFSLGLQAGISHSGWNLALVGQCEWEQWAAYAGPSISLSRGLPGTGPLGLNAGMDFRLPTQKSRISSLINLDYQLHFYHFNTPKTDLLQELHLSYGFLVNLSGDWFLAQQIGYGFFLENSYVGTADRRKTFSGYSGLLKLRAGYRF